MTYLDWEVLDAIDAAAYRDAKPFPWVNPRGALTEEGFRALRAQPVDPKLFTPMFGVKRHYGQKPHDRYELLYRADLSLPEPWRAFIAELSGARYAAFVARIFGRKDFVIRYQWHDAVRGCSVSPHCDGTHKIGSQLFYLNTAEDWDPAWGGATLVLDDGGTMSYETAPDFGDFKGEIAAETLGNRSFIFSRSDHAWHGVRPLGCPDGKVRRLFAVVIDVRPSWLDKAKERILKTLKNL